MILAQIQVDPLLDFDSAVDVPAEVVVEQTAHAVTAMGLLNSYAPVFGIAFIITLFGTPLVRRLAVACDIVDHPNERRKTHTYAVAYMGGVAVLLGLIAAVAASYLITDPIVSTYAPVPLAVVVGMIAITFTGLFDDVSSLFPRVKIAGQLVAAAALAINDVGVHVAEGLLTPLMGGADHVLFTVAGYQILNAYVFYWVGTALIAVFVLGGCNAANFVDGLDGLLSGIVGIVAVGLLAISVLMALQDGGVPGDLEATNLSGARLVLCMALLGAVLGFLPHNFNPASIFLGDCGSLLLGFLCVTIILMLGDQGQTHLVFAGLIIFAVPIIDTTLAIIRRKLAGVPLSQPDDQHLHHQLLRALGSVRRAVFAMYGISTGFAVIGVTLAALVMLTALRIRIVYAIAFVVFSFIGVLAVKAARQQQWRVAAAPAKSAPKPKRQAAPAKTPASKKIAPPAGETPPTEAADSSTK